MALTPVEIRHMTPGRSLFGYNAGATDRLLEEIAASFEDVWRERADLADRVEALETELLHHRERENLLSNTLLAAERAASEQKEDAARKSEQLVAEAHAESRQITRSAIAERERLLAEIRRIKALLRSALDVVDEGERTPQSVEPSDERRESWPARGDDTREFEAPKPSLYLSSDPKDANSA